jgi:hypothetical protein
MVNDLGLIGLSVWQTKRVGFRHTVPCGPVVLRGRFFFQLTWSASAASIAAMGLGCQREIPSDNMRRSSSAAMAMRGSWGRQNIPSAPAAKVPGYVPAQGRREPSTGTDASSTSGAVFPDDGRPSWVA